MASFLPTFLVATSSRLLPPPRGLVSVGTQAASRPTYEFSVPGSRTRSGPCDTLLARGHTHIEEVKPTIFMGPRTSRGPMTSALS